MRLRSVTAKNFKSLVDFTLDLAKFTCLIGLNGVGKSTVLQFIDFVGQQFRGDLKGWLERRHWKARELHSKLSYLRNIDIHVEIVTEEGAGSVSWEASFNTTQLRCSSERIITPGVILEVRDGRLRITDPTGTDGDGGIVLDERISFSYEGSVLSQMKDSVLSEIQDGSSLLSLLGVKNFFAGIQSLDLLSPDSLRQRTRQSEGSLGLGGQKLSAFLYEIGADKRSDLTEQLKQVYRHLDQLRASPLRSGWKQLEIQESYRGRQFVTEARHINDGMLRLIAILSELQSDHRFVLFDEIENGINPELVEFVINTLTSARQQVLVTTHSPMILNYLSDDVARDGVIYLYKTVEGSTRAVPFFSIPSLARKLTVMGPGEAFVDTNLTLLGDEIEQMPEGR